MAETKENTLAQQLALLRALADRPLTLPPIFVHITGSITAGLLLRQVLYWMGRTQDPEGWFYKRLPEFQDEMCMGEKEFLNARAVLKRLKLLQDERRGVPPVVWFRADLPAVLEAVNKRLNGESNSGKKEDSIPPKGNNQLPLEGENQLPPKAPAIPPKRQNLNSGEKAELYKEAETTRDYPETTKAEKRTRLSSTERDSWDLRRWREEFDKLQGASMGSGRGSDREWIEMAKTAAMRAGVTLNRLHELLKPFYPNDPNIDRLIEQNPLFPDEAEAAEPRQESPEMVQRRLESGKRAELAWEYVRDYLKHRTNPVSFDTWIKPLRPVSLDGGVLTLRMPNAEFKHVGDKFGDLIEQAIAGRAEDVKFVTDAIEQRATA